MDRKRITSIKIINTSWGVLSDDEIAKETLTIYRTGIIKHLLFTMSSKLPKEQYDYKVKLGLINNFFESLLNDIKVHKWKEDYSVPVCDGYHWELIIRYSDRSFKKVEGTVKEPPKCKLIKTMILNLVDFQKVPWIL